MFKEMNDTSMSLARKTARTGHLIHRFYQASASCAGGDPLRGQGRVLALLAAKPETTQRELSYLLDMRQQSLSELLAKLEEKSFVEREKSTEDGRVTVVRLTDAGRAAAPPSARSGRIPPRAPL
jgi:DNA-binding MarR family transcriptional regulator